MVTFICPLLVLYKHFVHKANIYFAVVVCVGWNVSMKYDFAEKSKQNTSR